MQTKNLRKLATVTAEIALEVADMVAWACTNRPHLVHLALRAKKARARTKNVRRIIREYLREDLNHANN